MIVHGRSADRDAAVVQGITSEGGPARFAAAGLSVPDDVRSLVTEAGDANILVNRPACTSSARP